MSAFLVTKKHIDYIINAARVWSGGDMSRYLPRGSDKAGNRYDLDYGCTDTGRMLWQENLRSVETRYPRPRTANHEVMGYVFNAYGALNYGLTPDPVVVIKSLQCLEYQSCEHDGWKTSAAKTFCDELLGEAIKHLPGYDTAPWGIE